MYDTVSHTGPDGADLGGGPDGRYNPVKDERTLAMLAHLLGFAGLAVPFGNVVAPLVLYLVKRDGSPFVADQAREAVNFQVWMMALALVALALVFADEVVGLVLLLAVALTWLGGMVVGAARAVEGVHFRYPLMLRLLRPPAPAASGATRSGAAP